MDSLLKKIHGPIYQHRLKVLVSLIQPYLTENDRVLDIGCGAGLLGNAIVSSELTPSRVQYMGVEKHPRGGEPIEVIGYDGDVLPFEDNSFDVVLIADVLHHDADPQSLLKDAARVSKKYVIVKDHKIDGLFSQYRVSFLDWAANEPHGVKCLYDYLSYSQWREMIDNVDLNVVYEETSINLYPPIFNAIFGRRLQYFFCASH